MRYRPELLLLAALAALLSIISPACKVHRIILEEHDELVQIRDLHGVVAGPRNAHGTAEHDYTSVLQEIGITAIRNNDYYDDTLDMEGMFNCTGYMFGRCVSGGRFNGADEYPCWAGCRPSSTTDPSLKIRLGDGGKAKWGMNYDSHDRMDQIISGEFEPFFRIGGSWSNRVLKNLGNVPNDDCSGPGEKADLDGHSFKGPQSNIESNNWRRAANYIIKYFRDEFGSSKFEYVDLWTEMQGTKFWDRTEDSGCGTDPDLDELAKFWADTHFYLQSLSFTPDIRFGGGGIQPGDLHQFVMKGKKDGMAYALLSAIWNRGPSAPAPDFIEFHMWEDEDPKVFIDAAAAMRGLLEGSDTVTLSTGESIAFDSVPWAGTGFFSNTRLIVGSYKVATDEVEGKRDDAATCHKRYNGGLGAALISAFWMAMQRSDDIDRAFVYRADDNRNYAPPTDSEIADDLETWYCEPKAGGDGLFYAGTRADILETGYGTRYKPKAHALRLASKLSKLYRRRLDSKFQYKDGDLNLWVMGGAASGALDGYAVLIANTEAVAQRYSVRIRKDGESSRVHDFGTARVYEVSDTDEGLEAHDLTGVKGSVTIGKESVHLVVLLREPESVLPDSPLGRAVLLHRFQQFPSSGIGLIRQVSASGSSRNPGGAHNGSKPTDTPAQTIAAPR